MTQQIIHNAVKDFWQTFISLELSLLSLNYFFPIHANSHMCITKKLVLTTVFVLLSLFQHVV